MLWFLATRTNMNCVVYIQVLYIWYGFFGHCSGYDKFKLVGWFREYLVLLDTGSDECALHTGRK